jgi:hypothetical protein
METNNETNGGAQEPGEAIRRLYVDGKIDANAATRQLLTLDSERRSHRAEDDEAPAAGGD